MSVHIGSLQQAIVSVKSGKPKADDVRVLKACEREAAAIGILITLDEPTNPMLHEATVAGTYHSDVSDKDYPRIQIVTVTDLLEKGIPTRPAGRAASGVWRDGVAGFLQSGGFGSADVRRYGHGRREGR